jgi:hypothetical protein
MQDRTDTEPTDRFSADATGLPEAREPELVELSDGEHLDHALRLENRCDGTHETRPPIVAGGTFTARVALPDPGVYRYHPHIREDCGQGDGPVRQRARRSG